MSSSRHVGFLPPSAPHAQQPSSRGRPRLTQETRLHKSLLVREKTTAKETLGGASGVIALMWDDAGGTQESLQSTATATLPAVPPAAVAPLAESENILLKWNGFDFELSSKYIHSVKGNFFTGYSDVMAALFAANLWG